MTKRILAAILAVVMLVTLTACNNQNGQAVVQAPGGAQATEPTTDNGDIPTNPTAPSTTPTSTLVFAEDAEVELGTPATTLDPEDVYEDLDYTVEMFYGDYRILGGDDAEAEYAEDMPLTSYVKYDSYKEEYKDEYITTVPFRIQAGPHTVSHVLSSVRGKDFMCAYFYNEDYYMTYIYCAYEVKGDTLYLNPLAYYNYDWETEHLEFSLSETVFEYKFKFEGRKLSLSDGTTTIEMQTGLEYDTDGTQVLQSNYLAYGSDSIEEIDYVSLGWYWYEPYDEEGTLKLRNTFYVSDEDYDNSRNGYAVMEENGLITFSLPAPGRQVNTYQFVYFLCGDDGIIFTDGDNTYYYTATWGDRNSDALGDSVSYEELDKLEDMTEEEIEEIMEKKADLLSDLAAAYEDAGLDVIVDEETGEITLDAEVLFDYNSSTISAEGQELLEEFITIYNSVVFDEKYEGFLSTIMVEGHTDSTGSYSDNLKLSQKRAESVRDFCVGVSGDYADALTEMMSPVGYADSYLITDKDGNEDAAASRRVSFRFLINLGD